MSELKLVVDVAVDGRQYEWVLMAINPHPKPWVNMAEG